MPCADGAWEQLPLAQPSARRGGRGRGGRQDRRHRRPGGRQAGPPRPRCSTARAGPTWPRCPTPREHLGAASDGRYLYAVGGRDLSADKNLPTLERYDPAERQLDGAQGHAGGGRRRGRGVRRRPAGRDRRRERHERRRTPSRHTTSGTRAGRSCRSCPGPARGRRGCHRRHASTRSAARPRPATSGRPRRRRCSTCPASRPRVRTAPSREWRALADAPSRNEYAAVDGGGRQALAVRRDRRRRERERRHRRLRPGDQHLDAGARSCRLPLHHASAVTYKGEAVVIGGFVPGDELTSEQSTGSMRCAEAPGSSCRSLNHPRAAAAAAVVGDKIVVVGGQADGKLVPPDRGVRRRELDRRRRHPDAARAPRRGLRRPLPVRGRWARSLRRQEPADTRTLRPRRATAGRR